MPQQESRIFLVVQWHTLVQQTAHNSSAVGAEGAQFGPGLRENVKKPPLTVNVINFDFFLVLMYPYGSFGVPLVPRSHDILVELFRFTRHVERNKVHFAPFLRLY